MNVVILWHMHQPYYVNPLTKKAMMPWVRLHAVKGYLDMIDLVTAQPELRVNFNFTPVLVRQILELVNREVEDEWETSAASRPPTSTTRNAATCSRIFSRSIGTRWSGRCPATPSCWPSAAPATPWPNSTPSSALSTRTTSAISRPSTISSGAVFPPCAAFPSWRNSRPRAATSPSRKKTPCSTSIGEILGLVLPEYRAAAERGQIELTTTPYFHPIMPLVYDTHIARRCQPQSPLPSRLLRAGGCPRPTPPGAGTARAGLRHTARAVSGPRRGPSHRKSSRSWSRRASTTSAPTKATFSRASRTIRPGTAAMSSTPSFSRAGASMPTKRPSRRSSASVRSPTSSASMPRATRRPRPSTHLIDNLKNIAKVAAGRARRRSAHPRRRKRLGSLPRRRRGVPDHVLQGAAGIPETENAAHRRLYRRTSGAGRDLLSPFRLVDPQRLRHLDRRSRGKQGVGMAERDPPFSRRAPRAGQHPPRTRRGSLVGNLRRRGQRLVLVVRPRLHHRHRFPVRRTLPAPSAERLPPSRR